MSTYLISLLSVLFIYHKMHHINSEKHKGKAVLSQAWSGPEFQEVKVPRFHDNGTGWW